MHRWLLIAIFACRAVATNAADVTVPAPGDTRTIQAAIDRCSRTGGGRVILPAGQHTAGTILLKNNVVLQLEKDAVLQGSLAIADYQVVEPFVEGTGLRAGWCFIGAVDAHNIGIEGDGTIDGRGAAVNQARPSADRDKRPSLIRFVRCQGVSLSGVRLESAAMWMVHLALCRDVRANGLTLRNHGAPNNDGFDLDSCDGAVLEKCDIDTSDDALCLKSTYATPSRHIAVRGCQLASDCGAIKLGTESLGGFEDVRIENCRITKGRLGGIKLFSVDGGSLQNVLISGIDMNNVSLPIFIRLGARGKTFHPGDRARPAGIVRNVTLENITAHGDGSTGVLISGLPEHPVEQITLRNLDLSLAGGNSGTPVSALPENESAYPEIGMFGHPLPACGFVLRHIRGLSVSGVKVQCKTPDARPLKFLEDVVDATWAE
jgi:polygalacturonase